MFNAVILPKDQDLNLPDKSIIHLPSTKYVLYIISDHPGLPEVVVDTKYEFPVNVYQQYNYNMADLLHEERNQDLMALRSKLNYLAAEILAPDQFYFKLVNRKNPDSTERSFLYRLYYNEIPCYSDESFLDNIKWILNMRMGPLIISTHALNVNSAPDWYVREMLRDMIELNQYAMSDKVMIEGYETGELYIYYEEGVTVIEDMALEEITNIRGNIMASLRLNIFPRSTPPSFIQHKHMSRLSNGQWAIKYYVPDGLEVFREVYELSYNLQNYGQLYYFLTHNSLMVEIYLRPSEIQVKYSGRDLLEVIEFIRQIDESYGKYIEGIKLEYKTTGGQKFHDHYNNQWAVLYQDNF